jgi:glycosyltransferase involved in cell wall biosynthesis
VTKHILLISYYWPPDNSSGVQRWAYFAHYLQKDGYNVEVVTVDPTKASYKNTDESFTALVSDIKTYTTSTFELLKTYSLITTGDSKKGIPRGGVDDKKSLFKKIANKVKANLFVPDARVGWNHYAIKTARTLIKQDTIIITTGPPQSTHLVGLNLKEQFPNNKWIADFRDPWLELYSNQNQIQSTWAANKNEKLEASVLRGADAITTIGPSLAKLLQDKLIDKSKVHFFYNGYDAKKMNSVNSEEQKGFVITFIGLLAEDYHTEGFLEALESFSTTNSKAKITLKLAGNIAPHFLQKAKKIQNLTTDYEGFVSHARSLTLMKSASILFTILPSQSQDEIIISGKMMEYLATDRPILCIGNKKGDAASLIEKCNAGLVVNHNESKEMIAFLEEQLLNSQDEVQSRDISRYSRKQIAQEFSVFLNILSN